MVIIILLNIYLKKGINVNEVQKNGSTALHGAAFYGQELIIQLLIDHGIDISIKNEFGHTAADEAKTQHIKELILNSNTDKIMNFFHEMYSKGLVTNIIPIKKQGKVICQKLMISPNLLPSNYQTLFQKGQNFKLGWLDNLFQYFIYLLIKDGFLYGMRQNLDF